MGCNFFKKTCSLNEFTVDIEHLFAVISIVLIVSSPTTSDFLITL